MKNFAEKISYLFEDKKKRYLYMLLFMLPFIIAIGIFGYIIFRDVKSLSNIGETSTEVEYEYKIDYPEFILRENATDLQKELFTELKGLYSGEVEGSDTDLAISICKNYVADFYTWSNKYGQYDVGGLYYVYEPQRKSIYLQARDSFYLYLNEYINKYDSENLLEVATVSATGTKSSKEYIAMDPETAVQTSYDEVYEVKVDWTYKENTVFSPSSYVKSMKFTVICDENGRFGIVEAH